uniref:Uncharacterized protein n=1 Tax=Amphimedon queenslandica TaxID=400682 RepID=A0A1X7UIT2_AMPQE
MKLFDDPQMENPMQSSQTTSPEDNLELDGCSTHGFSGEVFSIRNKTRVSPPVSLVDSEDESESEASL